MSLYSSEEICLVDCMFNVMGSKGEGSHGEEEVDDEASTYEPFS